MGKACGTQAGSPPKPCTSEKNQNSSMSCQMARVIRLATTLFKTDKDFRTAWLDYVMPEKLNIKHWGPSPMNVTGKKGETYRKEMAADYEKAKTGNISITNDATTYALGQIRQVIQSEKILKVINDLGIFKLGKDSFGVWKAFSPKNNNTAGCKWAEGHAEFRENVILLLLEQERVKGGRNTRNKRSKRKATRRN
jgi:hypothetical protein